MHPDRAHHLKPPHQNDKIIFCMTYDHATSNSIKNRRHPIFPNKRKRQHKAEKVWRHEQSFHRTCAQRARKCLSNTSQFAPHPIRPLKIWASYQSKIAIRPEQLCDMVILELMHWNNFRQRVPSTQSKYTLATSNCVWSKTLGGNGWGEGEAGNRQCATAE